MAKITKATAKRLVSKYRGDIDSSRIEINSDSIVLWFTGKDIDYHKGRDQVKAASEAIASKLPGSTVSIRGSHVAIFYREGRLPDPSKTTTRW